MSDGADVQHASFLDPDPISGLGTWGDPSNDFSMHDGGFANFTLSYPSYHILRRNFTIQPWVDFAAPELLDDPALFANSTFTKAEVAKTVDGFVGDFAKMQESIETFQVRRIVDSKF